MRIVPPVLFGLVALSAVPVRAGDSDVAVRLDYVRGPGAESCPDEHAVRHFLIGEFGYDPVQLDAGMTLKISIMRVGHTLRVALQLQDATGNSVWDDGFDEPSCMTLIRHSALKAKINIDYILRQRSTPPPPAPPVPPPPAPVPPKADALPLTHSQRAAPPVRRPDPAAPPPSEQLRFHVGLHALGQAGITPSVSVGGALSVEAVYREFGLGVEGRLASSIVPAEFDFRGVYGGLWQDPVPVQALFAAITVAPCYHRGPFIGCAVVDIGTLRSFVPGGWEQTYDPRVLAFGVRPAVQLPLVGRLAFRASVELSSIVTTSTLRFWHKPIWTTPPLFGTLAAGVVATFDVPVGKRHNPVK